MQEIPFARPSLGEEEISAVTAVLRSGWLTTGPEATAFEEEFSRFVGAPHALAVNSATAGLHLALEAAGVGPGTAVIVPSLTFTATAEVVEYLGAQVVFADITGPDLLIDPADAARRAEALVATGTELRAIVPVHLAGRICAMGELRRVADQFGAALIEDAAHAFPTTTPEGYAGTLADAGVFSFYANKTITTGEGGMVCTPHEEWARRIRIMRTHGIDRESWDRYRSIQPAWYYQVVAPGFKYNMPDTAAAIGRVQLRRALELLRKRSDCAGYYGEILSTLENEGLLHLPRSAPGHAWHLYIIQLRPGTDRDQVINALTHGGIGTSVHYIPLHRMPYWARRSRTTDQDLPRTASVADRLVSIPLYPGLRTDQQDRIAAVLGDALTTRAAATADAHADATSKADATYQEAR